MDRDDLFGRQRGRGGDERYGDQRRIDEEREYRRRDEMGPGDRWNAAQPEAPPEQRFADERGYGRPIDEVRRRDEERWRSDERWRRDEERLGRGYGGSRGDERYVGRDNPWDYGYASGAETSWRGGNEDSWRERPFRGREEQLRDQRWQGQRLDQPAFRGRHWDDRDDPGMRRLDYRDRLRLEHGGEGWRSGAGFDDPNRFREAWDEETLRRERQRYHDEHLGVGGWLREVVRGFGFGHPRDEYPAHHPGLIDRMRERFGRGPKGYRRSDERIREDVCELISEQDWLDASDVEVSVSGGEVTLNGTVPDRGHKRAVEDIAHRARGVRDVHNRLRIGPAPDRDDGTSKRKSTPETRV